MTASIHAVTLSAVMTDCCGKSRFRTRLSIRTSFCSPGTTNASPGVALPVSFPSVNLSAVSHWFTWRTDRSVMMVATSAKTMSNANVAGSMRGAYAASLRHATPAAVHHAGQHDVDEPHHRVVVDG